MAAARSLWMRWKMLRLPWRKTFLVGQDLSGNTFWQFRDQINHNRWRRIVKSGRGPSLSSLSELRISPQWHQWLRHTREDPPTMQEQAADVQRQAQLKVNAQLADERWAAKAKYIEKPKPASSVKLARDQVDSSPKESPRPQQGAIDENPSNRSTWTPEAWTPGASKR